MEVKIADTSKNYDDMVGFKSEENLPTDLSIFIGDEEENKPQIKPKPMDSDYPEQWQSLFVNVNSKEDYIKFMNLIGEIQGPKTKKIIFKKEKDNGLLNFFGD